MNDKLPIIINLFGGPGIGKSTIAAGLFYQMKIQGYSVELITEYAKELVYEGRYNILEADQLYIFAKQHRKIYRLISEVDYIITDSPMLMQPVYLKLMESPSYNTTLLKNLIVDTYYRYNNINIMLIRREEDTYQEGGRRETLEESKKIDGWIKEMVKDYTELPVDSTTVDEIIKALKEE